MQIETLRARLEKERETLKKSTGICMFSPAGPVSLGLLDAVVATIEAQQGQIETLEKRLAQHDHPGVV